MLYPNTGGYSLGNPGGDPNSLEERKRQLIQKLMAGRAQSGLNGHAQPLFGGAARGGSDHPAAALPSLSFNPFLAMAAGRPGEVFQAPNGITQQALQNAQSGFDPIMGGGADSDPNAPQNMGGDASQAGAIFTGAAGPGQDGAGGIAGSPGAAPYDPNQGWAPSSQAANVRHLVGVGGSRTEGLVPFFGNRSVGGRMIAS